MCVFEDLCWNVIQKENTAGYLAINAHSYWKRFRINSFTKLLSRDCQTWQHSFEKWKKIMWSFSCFNSSRKILLSLLIKDIMYHVCCCSETAPGSKCQTHQQPNSAYLHTKFHHLPPLSVDWPELGVTWWLGEVVWPAWLHKTSNGKRWEQSSLQLGFWIFKNFFFKLAKAFASLAHPQCSPYFNICFSLFIWFLYGCSFLLWLFLRYYWCLKLNILIYVSLTVYFSHRGTLCHNVLHSVSW